MQNPNLNRMYEAKSGILSNKKTKPLVLYLV